MDIKYYVINLDRSKERLNDILSQFSLEKLELDKVNAIDGQTLDLDDTADDIECRKEMGRSIQPGEVGCSLSHRRALETFRSTSAEFAVILEDDAVLTDEFSKKIEALSTFIKANPHLKVCAVNLGPSDYKYTTQLVKLNNTELLRAHRFPMLATGILWTKHGAQIVLDDSGKIKYPYDNYLRIKLTHGHVGLSVRPSLISSAEVLSDIDARSTSAGRSKQNRSRLYFYKKQKRVFREKIIAIISIINWKFQRPKVK